MSFVRDLALQTERLRLLPMTRGDLDFFHATNNDPFVRRYLWDDEPVPLHVSSDVLSGVEAAFGDAGWGLWKLLDNEGASLGYAGLWTFFDEPQPQLLYAILESFTGRGYATEAAMQVVDHTFRTLSFDYLDASMDVGNASSSKVCERLGFELHDEREMDGKPTRFYRMYADKWRSARGSLG
ncbi:MAG: GNAT family N-acetyltransferase [Halioglobus sp.]|nr:GNAT family N-acetyltransferase [Halioglobus sp.]